MFSYLHPLVLCQGPSEYLKIFWFNIPFLPLASVQEYTLSWTKNPIVRLDLFDGVLLYIVSFSIVLSSIYLSGLVVRLACAEEEVGGMKAGGSLRDALSAPPACYHLTKLLVRLLCSSPGGGHNAVFVCV